MNINDLCLAGIQAFKNGDFDTAVYQLEQATMNDPDSFRAFTFLGAAYAEQKRYNSAIGALRRAADLEPEVAKVQYNLGQAYEAAGVWREAWFCYKRALELDPYYQPARTAHTLLGASLKTMRESLVQLSA